MEAAVVFLEDSAAEACVRRYVVGEGLPRDEGGEVDVFKVEVGKCADGFREVVGGEGRQFVEVGDRSEVFGNILGVALRYGYVVVYESRGGVAPDLVGEFAAFVRIAVGGDVVEEGLTER